MNRKSRPGAEVDTLLELLLIAPNKLLVDFGKKKVNLEPSKVRDKISLAKLLWIDKRN